MWIDECKKAWEFIEHEYIETLILIPLNQEMEFHVQIDASLLAIGSLLAQNITRNNDQPMVYASRHLNSSK